MTNFMVIGNLTKDAVTRDAIMPSGAKGLVTDCYVAVNDGNGDSAIATYYKVTQWGPTGANMAPYLKKGRKVSVTGIPGQDEPWIDKEGKLHNGSLKIRRAKIHFEDASKATEAFEGEEIPE